MTVTVRELIEQLEKLNPADLRQTQAYIARNYTPEIQKAIEIHIRPQRED